MHGSIILCHSNDIEDQIIDHVMDRIKAAFRMKVSKGPAVELSDKALDKDREQYLTYPIFNDLNKISRRPDDLILAIIKEDLFVPEMDYIFGQANSSLKIALVSVKRLDPTFLERSEDMDLLKDRALKESIHEIGHLIGLKHCPNKNCAMYFSNCLNDTDRKGKGLCKGCELKL